MSHDRLETARIGERLASDYLVGQGMSLRERNWRCHIGEIDVIAVDGDCLVMAEVRTRRTARYGSPEESIGARKRRKLAALAEAYVADREWAGPWRVDFVAVVLGLDDKPDRVTHYPGAIGG
jgi:putative endonuclease